jgi:hypothetical protein
MTTAKLYVLLTLLKTYRAALTWTVPGARDGHDPFRDHADAVIADVRRAIADGGFYNHPKLRVAA